jgi:hypothetical protein
MLSQLKMKSTDGPLILTMIKLTRASFQPKINFKRNKSIKRLLTPLKMKKLKKRKYRAINNKIYRIINNKIIRKTLNKIKSIQ